MGILKLLKKIGLGIAILSLGGWTVAVLWFVSSSVADYFLRGHQLSARYVAWEPMAILVADGVLMILGVRHVLRHWCNRNNRVAH